MPILANGGGTQPWPPSRVAAAFGVHRALDTTGAMLGPLVAFGVGVDAYTDAGVVAYLFSEETPKHVTCRRTA